jgi:hypothetical protein
MPSVHTSIREEKTPSAEQSERTGTAKTSEGSESASEQHEQTASVSDSNSITQRKTKSLSASWTESGFETKIDTMETTSRSAIRPPATNERSQDSKEMNDPGAGAGIGEEEQEAWHLMGIVGALFVAMIGLFAFLIVKERRRFDQEGLHNEPQEETKPNVIQSVDQEHEHKSEEASVVVEEEIKVEEPRVAEEQSELVPEGRMEDQEEFRPIPLPTPNLAMEFRW